jgi:subtilisin family serine protease
MVGALSPTKIFADNIIYRDTPTISRANAITNNAVLIKLRNNRQKDVDRLISAFNKHHYRNIGLIKMDVKRDSRIIKLLEANGLIEFVNEDKLISLNLDSNDTFYSAQWGLTNAMVNMAWDYRIGGLDAIVAILDTGIDCTHPDLINNIWFDIDGTSGWTARDGVLTKGSMDDHGHGTHCAGIVGAVGNNGYGIAGINWQTKMVGFKFLKSDGRGWESDAILLIDKIIELKQSGLNIRIVNNSWSSAGLKLDESLRLAFQRLEESDILSTVAAGNDGNNIDATLIEPACYTNRGILTVMAIDKNNFKPIWSNYGYCVVDIAAPGVNILSTVPFNTNLAMGNVSGFALASGTSMATPHVSGIAALALSHNPMLSVYELKDLLLNHNSTDTLTNVAAISTTHRKINAYKVITNPLLFSPATNTLPTMDVIYSKTVRGGENIYISVIVTDPDNTPIHYLLTSEDGVDSPGSFAPRITFPTIENQPQMVIKAPQYSIDYVARFTLRVFDGCGGMISQKFYVNILRSAVSYTMPTMVENVYFTNGNIYSQLCYEPSDKIAPFMSHLFFVSSKNNNVGLVRHPVANCEEVENPWLLPDVLPRETNSNTYVVMSRVEDSARNIFKLPSQYVRVGNDTNYNYQAPTVILKITNDVDPLSINYDLRDSYDPKGSIVQFILAGPNGWKFHLPTTGKITFPEPGTYMVEVFGIGMDGFWVSEYAYATVFGPSPIVESPPVVMLKKITNLKVTRSMANVLLSWVDNSTNEAAYEVAASSQGTTNVYKLPPNSTSFSYVIQYSIPHTFQIRSTFGAEMAPVETKVVQILRPKNVEVK